MPATYSFDPTASKFSANNALYLAVASDISYQAPSACKTRAASDLGLDTSFQFFDIPHPGIDADTQAYVAACSTHAVLAFRGSVSINDWGCDFFAPLIPFGKFFPQSTAARSWLHAGFAFAAADSWSAVLDWIDAEVVQANRPLWVTGHSLGAALALVACADLQFQARAIPIAGLYTYGQPRVGCGSSGDFSDRVDRAFGDRYFRFVNRLDPVPRVPFRKMGYRHCGKFLHIEDDGSIAHFSPDWEAYRANALKEVGDFAGIVGKHGADHNLLSHTKDAHGHDVEATPAADTGPSYIGSIRNNLAKLSTDEFLKGF